jgi:hypothetical protein
MEDLYNFSGIEAGQESAGKVFDLVKAMNAGDQTGRELDGIDTSGAALKTESLDPALKVLTNTDKHIVFWKMLPKDKAYNTVEEYNQLVDYGLDVGIFNQEGETPQFNDSIYRRKSALVKYLGVSGEVTHPFTLVNLGSGVSNALAAETKNKMQFLTRGLDKELAIADSNLVSNQFDGIFRQHFDALATNLDDYINSDNVIDLRGKALDDAAVENAAQAVVNEGFGVVSSIMAPPIVFNDYVKRFHEAKRIIPGQPGGVVGATMGQSVNAIQTQFGYINIANDIFFDYKKPKAYNEAATSAKSPANPTPGGTPTAVVTDTNTKFGDGAGDYFYAVTSKNRYGESAMVILDTTAQSVLATEAVDLSFTQTDNAYTAESFVIYRTEKDVADYTTAKFYPIFTISTTERTNGYDGAAAGLVRDRNRWLPNAYSAMVTDIAPEVMSFKQLAPMMRMDLARTAPSYRFMVLLYGTPVVFAGKKLTRIINVGRDLS